MIEQITRGEFARMVNKYHYSKNLPKLNKHFLGDRELKAVISLGWGVRPVHTIQKLFPSLSTKDYFEIGKMCVADEMERNTESVFLSRVVDWIKKNESSVSVLFTWSDGMLGKPGYVYQAANFLYGGFIWTDTYFTADGEKVHPRQTGKIGGRPNESELKNLGWSHYRGKQFRYVRFLCSNARRKKLIAESPFVWGVEYPKSEALEWKVLNNGAWVSADGTPYKKEAHGFSESINFVRGVSTQDLLFGDIDAGKVSREIRASSACEGGVRFASPAP